MEENKASTHLCCFSDKLMTRKGVWKHLVDMPVVLYWLQRTVFWNLAYEAILKPVVLHCGTGFPDRIHGLTGHTCSIPHQLSNMQQTHQICSYCLHIDILDWIYKSKCHNISHFEMNTSKVVWARRRKKWYSIYTFAVFV